MPAGRMPEGQLAGEGLLAPAVPPAVEAALVGRDPVGRRLVGRVAGTRAEIQEERLVLVDHPQVGHELDGPVGQVGAQVVVGTGRRGHGVVVVVEGGHELVGLAAVEPVPAVEAPRERPGPPGRPHVGLVVGGEVPLAHGVGGVAGRPQDLGEEGALGGDLPEVAGIAHGQVGHPPHGVGVVVAAGQQTRPGRRAQGGRAEVGQAHPAVGQGVEPRRVDVRAVTAELGEAHVVEDDQHHVGRAGRRLGLGWPPGLRVSPVAADHPAERRHAVPNLRSDSAVTDGTRRPAMVEGMSRTPMGR